MQGQLNPRFELLGPFALMSVQGAAATCFGGEGSKKATFGVDFERSRGLGEMGENWSNRINRPPPGPLKEKVSFESNPRTVIPENCFPTVPAIHHVINRPRIFHSKLAHHDPILASLPQFWACQALRKVRIDYK